MMIKSENNLIAFSIVSCISPHGPLDTHTHTYILHSQCKCKSEIKAQIDTFHLLYHEHIEFKTASDKSFSPFRFLLFRTTNLSRTK